jgi:hypothetical protein
MYTKARSMAVTSPVILSEVNHSLANDSRVEGPAVILHAAQGDRVTFPAQDGRGNDYASGTGGQPGKSFKKPLPI